LHKYTTLYGNINDIKKSSDLQKLILAALCIFDFSGNCTKPVQIDNFHANVFHKLVIDHEWQVGFLAIFTGHGKFKVQSSIAYAQNLMNFEHIRQLLKANLDTIFRDEYPDNLGYSFQPYCRGK